MPTPAQSTYTEVKAPPYIIRDAPQHPDRLPEPIKLDLAALVASAKAAFPDMPSIAAKLEEFGPAVLRMTRTKEAIAEVFGLTVKQSEQVKSLFDLAESLYAPPTNSLPLIRSIDDVQRTFFHLLDQTREHLYVALVNNRYQLVHTQLVAIGDGQGFRWVSISSILQPALEREIKSVLLVHNHPSGDPTPSEEDYAFTEKTREAAQLFEIEVLDHVIVAKNGAASADRRRSSFS